MREDDGKLTKEDRAPDTLSAVVGAKTCTRGLLDIDELEPASLPACLPANQPSCMKALRTNYAP